jgi:hypothetical protein
MPQPMRALSRLAVSLIVLPIGCSRLDPAPGAASASASVASSAIPSSSMSAAPVRHEERAPDGGRAAPVGGNWLKCYASFRPRTLPAVDAMHLGLMCGPSNGMKKVTASGSARIEKDSRKEHRFEAEAGDCYRIFAVGEPSIEDLDVEVFDSAGKKLAFDTSDDRWPIVKPDGPFCVFEHGEYRAVVSPQRGEGSYALEIWRLR